MFKSPRCYFIAPDIQTPQLLQFAYIFNPVVVDLVVVDEQFPKVLEVVADGEHPEIGYFVLTEDQ